MELKTQALDRLLEVLSPALAKEFERIVNETREELEEQFQQRLSDAEVAFQRAADTQLQSSLTEVRESTEKEVTEALEQRLKQALEENTSKLQAEFAAERQRLEEDLEKWRIFADAQRQFAEASTQAEILARFLKLAEPFASGMGLYVSKYEGLALWKSRGNAAFAEIISESRADPDAYFRTILVRGKVVGAVSATRPCRTDIIDFLVSSVERAIEIFGLKLKVPALKSVAAGGDNSARAGAAHPGSNVQ